MGTWILILIFSLLIISYIGSAIADYIQTSRWIRERHLRELRLAMMQIEHPEFFSRTHDVSADEIRRAMHAYLPTGEIEVLGPGTIIFGEEMADELIKEANNRTVD